MTRNNSVFMSKTPTKLEKMGTRAEQIAWQGFVQGKGYRSIAEDINQAFRDRDESVSHMAVKNYKEKRFDEKKAEMGKENLEEIRKNEFEQVLDVAKKLEKVHDKLDTAIDHLNEKDRTDMGMLLEITKEVRQQLKFHKEYIEEVTQPQTQINNVEVNKTEIAMKVVNKLNELEDDDVIEIKDREKLAKTL